MLLYVIHVYLPILAAEVVQTCAEMIGNISLGELFTDLGVAARPF